MTYRTLPKLTMTVIHIAIGKKIMRENFPRVYTHLPSSLSFILSRYLAKKINLKTKRIFCFSQGHYAQITLKTNGSLRFIDYGKALDKVHHKELMKMLGKLDIFEKEIRVIQNIYW